jgi:hypothetical protein
MRHRYTCCEPLSTLLTATILVLAFSITNKANTTAKAATSDKTTNGYQRVFEDFIMNSSLLF